MKKTKILVLGSTGMLGNAVVRLFCQSGYEVFATSRSGASKKYFSDHSNLTFIDNVDVENQDSLTKIFAASSPNIVINCVGIVKQLASSSDPLVALPINSILPHRLARLCDISGARLIHISTDCVFSGEKGGYLEQDNPDASDLYGRSKFLGEVDYPNAITLRTSIIGHELEGSRSLISWFLSQKGPVQGFSKAVFSGLPTVELAKVIRDYVIPNEALHGLYHVSADPINKFDLLTLVAKEYGFAYEILKNDSVVIDRSLNSTRFRLATNFSPKA